MALLIEVRAYLSERRQASLSDMAARFRSPPEAMRGMLDHWIAKGKARRLSCPPSACGKGCGGCCSAAAPPEIYEWLEASPAPR